jgi:MinD-like ATPase involved in chromosome partitioning or flagellar assembly
MRCVIAAEPGAAEVIKENLRRRFPEWEFEAFTDAGQLFSRSGERPDAVVVSRFLPGDSAEILRRLPAEFPTSHTVLLVGVLNEQAKAYVRLAARHGLTNVVTGKLPGDKPYTLFAALTQARQELLEVEEGLEWEEEEAEEEAAAGFPAAGLDRGREAGKRCDGFPVRRQDGKLVLVAANKGGVGKTTAAIALSLALSRSGIRTCLCDFDFGGPNIAVFFDIKNKPGIEKLTGKSHVERFAKELLVKVENNLVILPGPMDRTLPYFEPGQLAEIVDFLAQEYLVIGDTPPEFWTKPWLDGLFPRADLVLAVVDQSKFSEAETKDYAPKLVLMGADPSRIRIVCNRFSAKLHSVKKVEAFFNAGIKAKKDLPRVIAAIPEAWEDFVKKGYRGEVAGLDDPSSPWQRLAGEVAKELGLPLAGTGGKEKKGLFSLFRKGWDRYGNP